jgi:hypothetical protein
MNRTAIGFWAIAACLFLAAGVQAQQPPEKVDQQGKGSVHGESGTNASQQPAIEVLPALSVPRLVKFSGVVNDPQGRPRSGVVGITFAIYKEQQGGAALWMETQNAVLDEQGKYTVLLGTTKSEGVPLELFMSGEPRWLGVQAEGAGEVEQARVLLVSVPYALKAADAETLGGLPSSAYALAQPSAGVASGASTTNATVSGAAALGSTAKATTSAKPQPAGAIATNFIPVFTNTAGALGSSVLFQNPSTNFLGLGTMSALTPLDLRLTAATAGDVVSVGNQTGGGRFGVLSFSRGAGSPFIVQGDLSDDLVLGANRSEKMRITSAGNVGIGTSAPFATLDVKGTANQVIVEGATSGGEASMGFIPGGSLHKWQLGVNSTGPGFFVYENGGGYRVTVQQGGNVGIGTSAPAATLDVNGTVSTGNLFSNGFLTSTNGGPAVHGIGNPGGLFETGTGLILQGRGLGSDRFLVDAAGNLRVDGGISSGGAGLVQIDKPGVPGGRFTVLPNGNVGVNNANPGATLDVGGGVKINGDTAMTSAPHMFFSAFFPGNFSTFGQLGGYLLLDKPIAVTNIFVIQGTPGQNCSQNGLVAVFFSTGGVAGIYNFSLMPLFANFSIGPINLAMDVGSNVFVEVGNVPQCGTTPANIWITFEYVMR